MTIFSVGIIGDINQFSKINNPVASFEFPLKNNILIEVNIEEINPQCGIKKRLPFNKISKISIKLHL